MSLPTLFYNSVVLPLGFLAAGAAALVSPKARRGIKDRKALKRRWERIASELPASGPRVWIHVTSVGEFEQARPLIERLSRRKQPPAVVVSFFSPSGMDYALRRPGPYVFEYLPLDTARSMGWLIELLRPSAIVFVKFDLWPNMIWQADKRKIPLILIDGTLSPSSRRTLPVARAFYRDLYRRFEVILAISKEDAGRFRAGAGEETSVRVAGDTRYDQVLQRRAGAAGVPVPSLLEDGGKIVWVVGSSWPQDERLVIPVFAELHSSHPQLILLLAPHEPSTETLERIEGELRRLDLKSVRYLEAEQGAIAPVVLVDRVGILAEIYRIGAMAYVGGAFGAGLHNVMEPAAMGLPLLFGPRWKNSHEAGLLLEKGAAAVVRTRQELSIEMVALLRDPESRRRKGYAGRNLIERHSGAVDACEAAIVEALNAERRGAD